MSDEEKALFCEIISSFFLPPTVEMAEQISGGQYYLFFKNFLSKSNKNDKMMKGFLSEKEPNLILMELEKEYDRLFSENGKEKIFLVESYYKPWTRDSSCALPFAKEKGFFMGDSAIHLLDLFVYYGLEIDTAFQGMPDHLVVELEFLSHLYKKKEKRAITCFIRDHLDWIPLLREELKRSNPHPFYFSTLETLNLFLTLETKAEGVANE